MESKRYRKISRLSEETADFIHEGDPIVIQEKLDGCRVGIMYDPSVDSVRAFSRNNELGVFFSFRGAYEYVKELNKEAIRDNLCGRYMLFAEWMVSHTVVYPEEVYNNLYAFDVYDMDEHVWLDYTEAKEISERIGLRFVPIFYVGDFISWEHCESFVGRTDLGGEYGEGVVCKKRSVDGEYVKIVGDKFKEVKRTPKNRIRQSNTDLELAKEITKQICTMARVRKILLQLVDEGFIPEDWGKYDMATIAKKLPEYIVEDCIEEEEEMAKEIGHYFGKAVISISMAHAREILDERQKI